MNLSLRPATHEALQRFRLRRQHLLRLRALLCGAALALAAFVLIALLDRAWFMPDAVRPWVTLLAYGGAAYAAWRVAWRFIAQGNGKEGTAKLIEAAEPALRERLLSAVELADPRGGVNVKDSVEFREKLQDDVAGAVEGIDWNAKLPTRTLRPWFFAAGGVVAVILVLCVIPGLHLAGFMARAALPFANLERPASVKIRILEPLQASTLAPIGSEMPVIIETEGPQPAQVTLEFAVEGSKPRRTELSAVGAARFEGVVPVGQTDVRYRVHAADAITPWRTLSARARPRIVEFTKTIVPPAYSGWQESEVKADQGDLEALDGSTIKLTLKANQPVSQSDFVLNPDLPEKKTVTSTTTPEGLLTADITVQATHSSWQIALKSKETGFTNEESTPWRITTIPDLPPTAQISEPAEQIELLADEAVRLTGLATDDVGLGGMKLAHAINGANWSERDLPFTKAAKEAPVQTLLPLAPLGVKTGDALLIKLIAIDLKGQKVESPTVRVVILEQTIDPRQREWAESQRRLAAKADRLDEQTRELRKELDKVRKTERNARKDPDKAKDEAANALASAQEKLEQVKAQSEELWNALKEASRDAPNQLDASEAQLLGKKLAQLRREQLPELEKLNADEIENTEPLKRAANEAASHASVIADALRAFAAEDTAKIAAQESQQLQRQSRMLTETSLQANRDAEQRPKWQEQQRALMAQAKTLQKDLGKLDESQKGRFHGQVQEMDKRLTETSADLASSLDKPDQTKSPEHLYGASDNLRSRLQQAADITRGIAEQTANEATQRRENLTRQDNPALAKLEEARNHLATAENATRDPRQNKKTDHDGLTSVEKAQKLLTESAKQLQDQAELREQNQATNTQAALDMNRASRAVDELARQTAEAKKIPLPSPEEAEKARRSNAPPSEATKAMANLKEQASQLAQAARALEADALAQDAAQALEAAQEESMRPQNQQDLAQGAAQSKAAAEALQMLPEKINRARIPEAMQQQDPQAANNLRQAAQQASDTSRNAAEQNKNLAREAAQQQAGQQLNNQPAQQATVDAQQKANELAAQLQPQAEAARAQLAALTPEVSEMMKRVAADLKKTQQETQTAADAAKAEKPVAEVAEKAQELRPEAAENAEKMASLQAALRQEANASDLTKQAESQLARTADVALAQMQQKTPQIAQNLKQAAQASQSKPQAQALQSAADAQQQTAQALDQLAQNMQKVEDGQQLTEAEQAAMQQMEQELGVQEPLDEAYERAKQLAEMAQDATQNPQAVLEALEKELPKNQSMQKALADTAQSTAQQAEQAVAKETQQAVQNGMAQKQAANDLARVSRHQQRLGDKEAAQQVAQASNQLQQAGQQAEATQANPVPNPQAAQQSQANAAQAAKAAEATASKTSPAMLASPLEELQGQMLAQALDQLDAQLHPMQGGQQQSQNGQQQQGQQQQGQQAQQSLNNAQQAQQQSMADSRNQGQAPGQKPSQQQAQNQKQQGQNSQAQSADGGNQSTQLQDGVLGQATVLVNGDWGHLPQKMADDLTEATRSEAAPEYRAAIESYYKAIAAKAKR
ncbi:MAG: hypothetical protein K9N47_22440 [Prosthecobacter sp.]|uniref:hypothetical protein n=1 Tax=Prosthecobacter sp. TaxID=1965333 RepID=UPI0026248B3C|nr:hypothetical protein [Prosthecobacter sp.]MCF7788901.1 hypothetical protein [Prosthecobacter sp.]